MLLRYLYVVLGGGVGSLLRYMVTLRVNESYNGRFPLATFLINICGSFTIGLLMLLLDREDLMHPALRPLLVTGLCGGFTTFSTYEWEIFTTGRTTPPIALVYALSSVVVGLLACWAGASLARR